MNLISNVTRVIHGHFFFSKAVETWMGNMSCEGQKEKRRGKQLLNGPHIIVTMTPVLLV